MNKDDTSRIPSFVGAVAILAGLLAAVWPAQGYVPDFLQIRVAVGASLAAAGLFLVMQVWFVKDRVTTLIAATGAIESLLLRTLNEHLPLGVTNLYLSLEQAPRWEEILLAARHIRFYGPEGATLLEHVVHAANKRTAGDPIIASMYLPRDTEPTIRNFDTKWTANSEKWTAAFSNAQTLRTRGLLDLKIIRIDKSPTISALQIDERYYQVTMLFPNVPEMRRPTLVMQPRLGDEYFKALWHFAK
jgi:hypothetical protein